MQSPPARSALIASAIVVVDERGEVFPLFRSLDLGIGIWRLLSPPTRMQLPPATVIIAVAYDEPDWTVIEECAAQFATIVAAISAREEDRVAAIRTGAFGYIDLAMSRDGLRRTVIGALRGEPAFSRDVIGALLRERHVARLTSQRSRALTRRQREILSLIAEGATDKEVATSLGIRTATAQKHVANLLRRLGVSNRAAAVGSLFTEPSWPGLPGTRRQ